MEPMNIYGNSCLTKSDLCPRGSRALWAVHNFLMWFIWVVLTFIVLCSARYFRQYWKRSMYIHTSVGISAFLLFLAALWLAWSRNYNVSHGEYFMKWNKWAAMFENIAGFYGIALCLSGIVAWFWRRYGNYEWNTTFTLNLGKFHKYFSWTFLIFIQLLVMFGIMDTYHFLTEWVIVAFVQFAVFATAVIYLEVRFNRIWFEEVPYVLPATVMTVEEFEKALHEGKKYVILDDLILDVSEFYKVHPGGKFVIEHTVGTDIAKFFYGGYSLEDNMKTTPASPFRHSNYARMIANDLAVARLDCRETGAVTSRCRLRWDKDNVVNKLTRSFFFETMDKEPRHNYKAYYPGMKFLTRHFWLRSMNNTKVTRHYTTCNAMATGFYNELVRVLRDERPDVASTFNKAFLDTQDTNTMTFTIKNYKREGGFSYRPFDTDQRAEYEIKGPMGKGLAPAKQGVHLAFCAGTGALCFVDMMAHIALAELGLLSQEDLQVGSIDPTKFEMHLYASFPSKAEAVAWDLMEALDAYCKRKGSKSFELHPRLSKEKINTARWNEPWIEKTLLTYPAKEVERMWCCGPPVMNETFDRTLMDMRRRLAPNQLINQFHIELL